MARHPLTKFSEALITYQSSSYYDELLNIAHWLYSRLRKANRTNLFTLQCLHVNDTYNHYDVIKKIHTE